MAPADVPPGQLAQDLRDVLAWLEHRHHAQGDLWLHVMRAPSQPDGELSIATVDTDRRDFSFDRLHADFLAALTAFGYHLAWPTDGADPEDIDVPSCTDMLPEEVSASVHRIEQAVCKVRPFRRRLS